MEMNICACITEKTLADCLKVLRSIDTEFIEHRIDHMERIEGLNEMYGSTGSTIIATNRSKQAGGKFKGTEEERIGYLIDAVDAGCNYVDVELETDEGLKKKVLEHARNNGCKIIISTHDFSGTSELGELVSMMRAEERDGADIGKIVTYANTIEDCHTVLELLMHAKNVNFKLVAFTMGSLGGFTRVLAPVYGAPFTYASVDHGVAEGQFDVKTLRKIWEALNIG